MLIPQQRPDYGDAITSVSVPTLLLWGDADPVSPDSASAVRATMSPNPTVANTVTLKYRPSIRVSGCVVAWFLAQDSSEYYRSFKSPLEELPDGVALSLSVVRMLPVGAKNFYIIGGRRLDQNFLASLVLPAGMRTLLYFANSSVAMRSPSASILSGSAM